MLRRSVRRSAADSCRPYSNDGSDYTRIGSEEHVWFERVPDDAEAPGSATGYWLDDAKSGPDHAACLDGSAPLYYHRPGTGDGKNKWYIHHEGGGWCYNLEDCAGRAKGALGSTTPAVSKDTKTSNLGGGYFSTDPKVSPQMYNWNHVVNSDAFSDLFAVRLANPRSITISVPAVLRRRFLLRLQRDVDGGQGPDALVPGQARAQGHGHRPPHQPRPEELHGRRHLGLLRRRPRDLVRS